MIRAPATIKSLPSPPAIRNSATTSRPAIFQPHRLLVLRRFFQDYKQLEGKKLEVEEIRPSYAALNVIEKSLANYKAQRGRLLAEDTHAA